MLKYVDTKVTFSEVPEEISLCISLSGCPYKCKGCHSSYLQEDVGTELTEEVLSKLINDNPGITCVCFMGGDNDVLNLYLLIKYVKEHYKLKTCWYSGNTNMPNTESNIYQMLDFIKLGPYIEKNGPLTSPTTNQRFYKKHAGDIFIDITSIFFKK